jgi:hypothetical protein
VPVGEFHYAYPVTASPCVTLVRRGERKGWASVITDGNPPTNAIDRHWGVRALEQVVKHDILELASSELAMTSLSQMTEELELPPRTKSEPSA